jgi:hypothetical protein
MKSIKENIVILLMWGAGLGQVALGLALVYWNFGIVGYPVFVAGLLIVSLVFPSVYNISNKTKKR